MTGIALAVTLLCAGLMGYAIQRGATCMVAAIEEAVFERRTRRMVALAEAALWVAAGLAVASMLGWGVILPSRFSVSGWTIAGGALLGIGAFINRACVFGSIARLGSGEWAYALTPAGFFVGCFLLQHAPTFMAPHSVRMPPSGALLWLAIAALPLLIWRGAKIVASARRGSLAAHIWSPHMATAIIGWTFLVLMLVAGPWAYTEALAELARGDSMAGLQRLLLFIALVGGAIAGGWTADRLRITKPSPRSLIRAFAGGLLMGMGSLLIPGGNDGLILTGLPFLQPHALIGIAAMAAVIAVALKFAGQRSMDNAVAS